MKRYLFYEFIYIVLFFTFLTSGIALAGDISGKVKTRSKKYRENTVIYIDKIQGKSFAHPKEHAVMDQKNMKFIPHVLPILKGTSVDFLNSDALKHNVFSPDNVADKFNLGTWPQGEIRSYTFNKSGEAVMLCNVHPEMEAWVVVLETPYFAVSDKQGSFIIKDVPPGEYTLRVWNKKLKGADQKITVTGEEKAIAEIELKR